MFSFDRVLYTDDLDEVMIEVTYDSIGEYFYASTIYGVDKHEASYPVVKVFVDKWINEHEDELFEYMSECGESYNGFYK